MKHTRKTRFATTGISMALISATALSFFPVSRSVAAESRDVLRRSLTFHASFDKSVDADRAVGDKRLYSADSYDKQDEAVPGLHAPKVALAPDAGRFGGALKFAQKNTHALFYHADLNVAYLQPGSWSGSISFWLSLDPEKDLAPGYCDPIQITDKTYNDNAIWVDFTKDERPRHFRLGVFGNLKEWNGDNPSPDNNPAFLKRLVVVQEPPFASGKWTHVVITCAGLNGPGGGTASLYLNGQLQGSTTGIRDQLSWVIGKTSIRLGINYTGLFDDLTIFNRALTASEVEYLHSLSGGVRSLFE